MKIKDGVENWQILQALVNGTKPLGLGIYDPRGHEPMSDTDAKAFCMGREQIYVDYCNGKPIKTRISDRPLPDFWGYDRDAGQGKAVKVLRAAGLIED